MDNNIRILVVDDEETLCEALRFHLESEGYKVDVAHSAEEVLCLDQIRCDVMLLDIMMGEISGIQLAHIMKSNPSTSHIPIIFCTAKDTEDDMIRGLDLGADDYIMKPYSLKAVSARIRAVLRRTKGSGDSYPEHDKIGYMGLTIIPDMKQCYVDGEEVKLPKKEFEILKKLLLNRGHIFSRVELLKNIWPEDVIVLDRVVDVNITRIRQKIGKYGKNIVTRSGYGYGFME